jgi:putative ABC transport system permease protein
MKMYLRLVAEAASFAWDALRGNVLRTMLSLLGVTVGIFAIVTVFTAVDSLERNIRKSMSFLGSGVIYVQKWPWVFEGNFPWWRYMNRPMPSENEFHFLKENLREAEALTLMANTGNRTFQAGNNSFSGASLIGTTYDYAKTSDFPIGLGRYFTTTEIDGARGVGIIGVDLADNLFPGKDPIGKKISYKGGSFTIIGVSTKGGKTLMGTPSRDNTMVVPYGNFKRLQKVGRGGTEPMIIVKAYQRDKGMVALEGELRSVMRSRRSLKPYQEDSFALNRPESVGKAINNIFGIVTLAGGIIGSFSILVGGFGIANIMFVSVRERTNLIGIQKSLGARNAFILYQFLFEAILLSLAGGMLGIGLVYLVTLIPQDALPMEMSEGNVLTGATISAAVGLVAGLLPALQASQLDPVEAIRSK